MRVFIKDRGAPKIEAWVEDFDSEVCDWQVVCTAQCIAQDQKNLLIDEIETPFRYRKRGYATALITELQKRFESVAPIGVLPRARSFWARFGMTDAGGNL